MFEFNERGNFLFNLYQKISSEAPPKQLNLESVSTFVKKSNLLSDKYLSIQCFLTSERALQRFAGFDRLSFRYEEHKDEEEVW